MKLRTAVVSWVVAFAFPSFAQTTPQLDGSALVYATPTYELRVSLTAEGALRFTALASKATPLPLPSSVQLPAGKPVQQVGDHFEAGPSSLQLDPTTGAVSVTVAGKRVFTVTFTHGEGPALSARLDFEGSSAFHGLGQAQSAPAYRSERFELVHTPKFGDQTYLYIPFFLSDAGLAVYSNAASGDLVRFEKGTAATLTSATGALDFYLFGPDTPSALVSRFYRASNSRSLLPRWAYGYLQSRFGYRTDAEVRRVVSTASRQGIPLSAIVLDLYWFRRMGDLEWNTQDFPDPKGLADWLEEQHVKLVTISEPFIAKDSKSFAELDAAHGLAKRTDGGTLIFGDWWDFGHAGGGVIDPTSEATAQILSKKYEALVKKGVDGFWIDLGEPERVPGTANFGQWPEEAYHDFFNLAWARIVRGAIEKASPGQRPFILSRSGWTGVAGLGVATWSGDVPATWDGLQRQIPLGLNASVSGLPFWGSDVGGFVGEGGELIPPDPELLLRWQQFGALSPIDRAHGYGPREPWIYGPEWLGRISRAIALRTSLGPYLYSTAYQVMSQGLPMMRPLFLLEPHDARWQDEDGEYLLGDSALAAPVLEPLSRTTKKTVRLPAGRWYDASSLEPHEGTVELALTLETIPLYFKEGAIVPMDQHGIETVLLLPAATPSTFTVFSDDGLTEAYRTGAGEKLLVTLDQKSVTFANALKAREVVLRFPKDLKLPLLEKKSSLSGAYREVKVMLKVGTTKVLL